MFFCVASFINLFGDIAAKTLLRYSTSTNYTDVLNTEQNLLSAWLEQVNARLEQWMAVISLYHTLVAIIFVT